MRAFWLGVFVVGLTLTTFSAEFESSGGDRKPTTIDGRVVQITLPARDIVLSYNESREVFTVELKTEFASAEAASMYVGDGEVALELRADPTNGIFLQGDYLPHGTEIKKQAVIQVKPGYKLATELGPGDVYVKLKGVHFKLPQ